jgi:hypothetical protein
VISDVPLPKSPEQWRNFGTHFPIPACRLNRGGLKTLYGIINDLQTRYRDKCLQRLFQQSTESDADFVARKLRVQNAFVTSVTVTARNDEKLTGNSAELFDAVNFPTDLRSIFYSTQSVPQAVLSHLPEDRVTLFLDFSQPPILDFGKLPTFATVNESNFEIAATDESWFVLSKTRLSDFFRERRSGYDWIHGAGVYDVLLYVFGLPLGIWGCVKLGNVFPSIDNLTAIPRSLVYGYTFLLSLIVFRVAFSYCRWVLPKVEIETSLRRSPFRNRGAWIVVLGALFWPGLYDVVKALILSVFR